MIKVLAGCFKVVHLITCFYFGTGFPYCTKKKMENNYNSNRNQADGNGREEGNKIPDISKLEAKWGVSAEEIQDAINHVGVDRSDIEEYLVNKKWQKTKDTPFQKGDLNEK
jgi:hypothetical protein